MRILALFALAGCGTVVDVHDAAPLDPNRITSGTRLKVRWYDYGGDARATSGLFDAERNEPCIFSTWADGQLYCVPTDTAEAVYTDARCTQLAGRASSCSEAPPAYLVETAATACTSTVKHLFQRGPQLRATEYYVRDFAGACQGPISDPDSTYYLPGTEVPASQLVALARDQPDPTVRLSAPAYTSADGARFRSSMYDSTLATPCFFSIDYAGAGTGVCAPSNAPIASLYLDGACSLPIVDSASACPAPAYAQQLARPECPVSQTTYRKVASTVAPQMVYSGGPGSCTSSSASPDTAFHVLGDPVTLAPVSRVRDMGAAPLQVIRYVADALTFRDGTLYDNTLGTECRTRRLADGTYRCLPATQAVQSLFTNATCTQAIDLVEVFPTPATCGAPVLLAYASRTLPPAPGSCVSGLAMHAVGAEYTGPLFESVGMCTAVPATGSHYYRVGPQLSMTQFPQATLVTDP